MTRRTLFLPTLLLPTLLLPTLCLPTVFAEEPSSETRTAMIVAPTTPALERVSLDYRDAELSNVLRSLSYTYNLNLVTSSDVKGKVTVNLKDVTVEEALDAILTTNGLTYSRKGNLIYINASSPEGASMVSTPIPLKYLKAVDAQNLLRRVLSPKGDVKVDEVSNTLVITDFPGNVERVKRLLNELDLPPQQVLIEAKIVDITSKDLQNLGVTWTADWKPAGDLKGLFHRSGGFQEQLKVTQTLAGTSSSLSGGQFKLDTLTLKGLTLTATIDALIRDEKAHLLASPSIAVLNNQEARIVIGEKVPFKERTQTTTGTTETTKFIDVGTTLRVTPSINADGYITMRIHPEVSSVSALLDAGPRITTREADTTVRIKEGETIVIAGLIKQEDNRSKSHIPILGALPILDHIFGSRSKDQTQTELAVFITPKILRSREETAAFAAQQRQKAQEAEAYVTLPTTGSLGLVLTLYQKATLLETGWGLESRRKPAWFRLQQAVNLYEHIAVEFPDSPQAAESLYRAAKLQRAFFKKTALATANLQRVLARYPDSRLVPKAQALLREIEQPGGASRRHDAQVQQASREWAHRIAGQKQAERRKAEREQTRRREREERRQQPREAVAPPPPPQREREDPRKAQEAAAAVREAARAKAEEDRQQRLKAREEAAAQQRADAERRAAVREATHLQQLKAKEQAAALTRAEQERRRAAQEQDRQRQREDRRKAQEAAAAVREAARAKAEEDRQQRLKATAAAKEQAAAQQRADAERRTTEQEQHRQREREERRQAQIAAAAAREAARRQAAVERDAARQRVEQERLERVRAQEEAAAHRQAQLEQERQRRLEERRRAQEQAETARQAARRRADAERVARLRRQVEEAARRLEAAEQEQAIKEATRLERLQQQLEEAEQAAAQ